MRESTCPKPPHYAVSQAVPLVQIGDHGDQSFVLFPAVLFQVKDFRISDQSEAKRAKLFVLTWPCRDAVNVFWLLVHEKRGRCFGHSRKFDKTCLHTDFTEFYLQHGNPKRQWAIIPASVSMLAHRTSQNGLCHSSPHTS